MLFRIYYPHLNSYFTRKFSNINTDKIDEICSEIFLKLINKPPQKRFEHLNQFHKWLILVGKNLCIDYTRCIEYKNLQKTTPSDKLEFNDDTNSLLYFDVDQINSSEPYTEENLIEAYGLNAHEAQCFLLKARGIDNMTIAEMLNCQENAVRTHLSRAKNKLNRSQEK